jgi:hypothetical protein
MKPFPQIMQMREDGGDSYIWLIRMSEIWIRRDGRTADASAIP